MAYNPELMQTIVKRGLDEKKDLKSSKMNKMSDFEGRNLASFSTDEEAYHQFMYDLIKLQYSSTQLVLTGTKAKRIFVDGGFSKNAIYMNLLALIFVDQEVFAASMAQSTALGAALAIHDSWNPGAIPNDIIELKYYGVNSGVTL